MTSKSERAEQHEREIAVEAEVRKVVTGAIRSVRATKSREQIAAEMSERIGRTVTVHMLNDFTSESKVFVRFPAAWIVAFCSATGDERLQRLVLGDKLRKLLEF